MSSCRKFRPWPHLQIPHLHFCNTGGVCGVSRRSNRAHSCHPRPAASVRNAYILFCLYSDSLRPFCPSSIVSESEALVHASDITWQESLIRPRLFRSRWPARNGRADEFELSFFVQICRATCVQPIRSHLMSHEHFQQRAQSQSLSSCIGA